MLTPGIAAVQPNHLQSAQPVGQNTTATHQQCNPEDFPGAGCCGCATSRGYSVAFHQAVLQLSSLWIEFFQGVGGCDHATVREPAQTTLVPAVPCAAQPLPQLGQDL